MRRCVWSPVVNLDLLRLALGAVRLYENWLPLLTNKLGSRCARTLRFPVDRIRMRNGLVLEVRNNNLGSDLAMLDEIWNEECYTPPFVSIGEDDIVLDVGANKGYFALYASAKARAGKIFSFEPVPEIYALLKSNIQANRAANVFPFNVAISDRIGVADIHISSQSGAHSLYRRDGQVATISVPTDTIEHFCRASGLERIDFLKLDCEGAEYDTILKLSPQTLAAIGKISLEYHEGLSDHTPDELVRFLVRSGFMVARKRWYIYAMNRFANR